MKRHTRPPPAQPGNHASPIDELLDEIAASEVAPPGPALAHGRSLEVEGREFVRICDRDGAVELEVRVTVDGPRLVVRGAAIELVATRSLDVRCERFSVTAELGVSLTAERGDVRLDAGDDVVVTGERVLLN